MTPEQIAAARELINQVLTGNHRPTPAQWAYKLTAALDALTAANQSLADERTDNARLGESLVQVMQERNNLLKELDGAVKLREAADAYSTRLRSCLEETEAAKTTTREERNELRAAIEAKCEDCKWCGDDGCNTWCSLYRYRKGAS